MQPLNQAPCKPLGGENCAGLDTDAGIKAILGFCKTQPPQWSIVIVGTTTTEWKDDK